jgi:pyruvate,water dikinase
LKNKDVELVGGKNASIGEMISGLASLGVSVPGGFATTSHAYRDFLAQDGLDERIRDVLAPSTWTMWNGSPVVGKQIRGWMLATPFPARLKRKSGRRGARWVKAASSRWPCAPRRPPRICRRPPSPASRKLSERARRRASALLHA